MKRNLPNERRAKHAPWFHLCCALALAAAAPSAAFAQVTRTDVLECVVQDGSRFILKSKYKWVVIPIPGRPDREYDRESWHVTYRDRQGRTSSVPAGVHFQNRFTQHLITTCSEFGMWNGTALGPYTYLRSDGTWHSREYFPWHQLDVNPLGEPGSPSAERAARLAAFGINDAAFNFAFIAPDKGKLLYEQPLHESNMGYQFDKHVDAVFQAESSDGGATWSKGEFTRQPRIFEVGKGRSAQAVRAVPVLINGKKVVPEKTRSDCQC